MTELLRQVVTEIEKLPAEQQDAIATRLLAELKDEQAWEKRFKATTDKTGKVRNVLDYIYG